MSTSTRQPAAHPDITESTADQASAPAAFKLPQGLRRHYEGLPIQRKVTSQLGEWEDTKQLIVERSKKEPYPIKSAGVDMSLSFLPTDGVKATKIGFLQAVTRVKKGEVDHRQYAARAVPSGVGKNWRIDTVNHYNPMYGSKEPGPGTAEWEHASAETERGPIADRVRTEYESTQRPVRQDDKVTFGARVDGQSTPAVLRDKPEMNDPDAPSEQLLETTAMALAGDDKGKAYSTVEWGWRRQIDQEPVALPLRLVSEGMADNTRAAATHWNSLQRPEGEVAVTEGANSNDYRNLKQAVPLVPVQLRTAAEPPSENIRAAAQAGIETPSSTLPFLDRMQPLFGRHALGQVQAHQGPEASAAARAMGARAFASGNHVVLGESASLHDVAHEAAHVVQQRGGVQLAGGIGAAGDGYERQADAVADRVVAGQSAEALLDGKP